jgi:hypothetical protein
MFPRTHLLLTVALVLVAGCSGTHWNSGRLQGQGLLSDEEYVRVKLRLQKLQLNLRQRTGEELVNALSSPTEHGTDEGAEPGRPDFFRPSPSLARSLGHWTEEDEYFCPAKNYFIEKELASRGSRVKEVFIRHQRDPREIYVGFQFRGCAVRDLCVHHLQHLDKVEAQRPDEKWDLYLSYLNSVGALHVLICDATAK